LENSRKINRSEIIPEEVSRYSAFNEVEQTAGNWADTKDGVSIWFPDFAGIGGSIGRTLIGGFYWRKFMG